MTRRRVGRPCPQTSPYSFGAERHYKSLLGLSAMTSARPLPRESDLTQICAERGVFVRAWNNRFGCPASAWNAPRIG